MVAYLRGEPGANEVRDILTDNDTDCIAHSVNLAEVYKHFAQHETTADAEEAVRVLLDEAGIVSREDMDAEFWKSVASSWATIKNAVDPSTGKRSRRPPASAMVVDAFFSKSLFN